MSFIYPMFPDCGGAPGCPICETLDAMTVKLDRQPTYSRVTFGVRCQNEEHDRCRSAWGIKPCRCKCHRKGKR